MNNYKIRIKESDERVVQVIAPSYDEACDKLEEMIDNGTLYLDPENYERHYENAISEELTSNFTLKTVYNNNVLKCFMNNDVIEFPNIHTVKDLKQIYESICDGYLENSELVSEEIKSNEEEKCLS